METKWLIAFAIGIGLPILLHRTLLVIMQKKLYRLGMQRLNYRGMEVLTGGGVLIVVSTVVTLGALLLFLKTKGTPLSILDEGLLLGAGMVVMAFWGWQDDRSPDPIVKGFRGHFGALWHQGEMTSGLWKAWGGGSTAFLISLAFAQSFWSWLLAICLLAITPNVLNLFDLRPARALKVFWFLLFIAGVAGYYAGESAGAGQMAWVWFLPVITSSIFLFRHDAGGKIMLGDTGANALGFVVGYAFVITTPAYVQGLVLLLFISLHIVAEFISISQYIERFRWLRRMDSWGRSAKSD
ncbi:UDP-N-acetylmuramyl pentapeptide phosphotransferase [Brevibacillus sp. NRS-1366]|uniref:UDP-N-acetylmuramyl pentapeptide phosphotransferase n=1 Tax=Brevibacillus sp. NRS-1366 TaxID=3233899 RepID=UPI003D1BEF6D